MEANSNNQIGSIANTRDRLLLWASRSSTTGTSGAIGSLIRVEYASEFSRQQVMEEMRSTLLDRSIPLYELVLPTQQEPVEIVRAILAQTQSLPVGVLSVTGFANAFSNKISLPDAMRVLNFNRDKLVANSLCQIWWMTPVFAHTSLFAMPDITSWFIAKLQLTENQPIDQAPERFIELPGGSYANIDDARRRAQNLLQRLQVAKEAGVDDGELLETFLLPALEALAEVGAQKDLRDLSLQFEGILGQLQMPASPHLAISLSRIANLYHDQGRYAEAEQLYLRSLAVREEQLGGNHANTSTSINNLAELYRDQGRYEEAEPLFLKALTISEKQSNYSDISAILNNLANVYQSMGRYDEAEPLYVRSLAIREKQLGADHPDTATSLNNLAGLYRATGRYIEAEPLFSRSLAISEKQLGVNHPDTANSLNNLAGLYGSMSRYAEAEPLLLRSLSIREAQLGMNHPNTATSLNNLAGLYQSTSRYAEAKRLYIKAIQIAEVTLGIDHPSTKTFSRNLENLKWQIILDQSKNSPT